MWDGEDVFGRGADGSSIEVNVKSFCSNTRLESYPVVAFCVKEDRRNGSNLPSAFLTCTSFQNLFVFALPPPEPALTALRS